jgi:hypothetical protein
MSFQLVQRFIPPHPHNTTYLGIPALTLPSFLHATIPLPETIAPSKLNPLFNTTAITHTNVSTRPTLLSKPKPIIMHSAIFRTHKGHLAAAYSLIKEELAPSLFEETIAP